MTEDAKLAVAVAHLREVAPLSVSSRWDAEQERAIGLAMLSFARTPDPRIAAAEAALEAMRYDLRRVQENTAIYMEERRTETAAAVARSAAFEAALTAEDEYWAASRTLAAAFARIRPAAQAAFDAASVRRDQARAALTTPVQRQPSRAEVRGEALEEAAKVADEEEARQCHLYEQNVDVIHAHRASTAFSIATAIRALNDQEAAQRQKGSLSRPEIADQPQHD